MFIWGSRKVAMLIVIIILSYLSSWASAQNLHQCVSNGNYTTNSTYSANLNALFDSLSSNMTDYGFFTASVGQNPNTVHGFALCRADRTLQQCRACVNSAAGELLRSCPNQRQAVMWYEYCTLRYSNEPIHETQTAETPGMLYNTQNVSNGDGFREERTSLMADLTERAANGTSAIKAAAGTRNSSDSQFPIIYALLQCTPDFSSEDCRACLSRNFQRFQTYVAQGVQSARPRLQYSL